MNILLSLTGERAANPQPVSPLSLAVAHFACAEPGQVTADLNDPVSTIRQMLQQYAAAICMLTRRRQIAAEVLSWLHQSFSRTFACQPGLVFRQVTEQEVTA